MSMLAQLIEEIQTEKAVNKAHSDPNVHGPNGLFGVVGGERDVISSRVAPNGLASALPVSPTVTMLPLYPYITGKTAASGAQVAGSCNNAPSAGNLLTAYQTAQFGTTQFATRELDVTTVGQVINPGEALDLRYVNDPLAEQMGRAWFGVNASQALVYGREVLMRMVEVGIEFQQYLSTKLYTGTGTGVEFQGLEALVKVNHLDANTGLAVTSLDSDVRDFSNADITVSANAAALVATLLDMYRNLDNNGRRMGFGEVGFHFVMRPQMFTDVTDVWPCQMATFRCASTATGAAINVQTDANLRIAQEMRAGKFLWVDGKRIPVILDDFIPQTDLTGTTAGLYTSDIYLLPLTIRGGRPSLYWEYFDYSVGMNQAIRDGQLGSYMYIDRGLYAVTKRVDNWCAIFQVKNQARIRLETPHLAGRLMNVGHVVTTVYRSSNEADVGYISSGASGQTPPSYVQP